MGSFCFHTSAVPSSYLLSSKDYTHGLGSIKLRNLVNFAYFEFLQTPYCVVSFKLLRIINFELGVVKWLRFSLLNVLENG